MAKDYNIDTEQTLELLEEILNRANTCHINI